MLAERVNRIALSPTLRISARAQQMRAQGIDVVDFSAGEPDFPTPEAVKRACKAAIDANFTKYVANDGIPELKAAIREKLEKDNGLARLRGGLRREKTMNLLLANASMTTA